MMTAAADLDRLRKQARALVDALTEDECGAMVGGQWMGGHGGLLSRNTLSIADNLRRTLDAIDREVVPA